MNNTTFTAKANEVKRDWYINQLVELQQKQQNY